MSCRILLAFEHATCDIGVDVHVPLSKENSEVLADRVRPACPICKEPMIYIGFWIGMADPEDPLRIERLP